MPQIPCEKISESIIKRLRKKPRPQKKLLIITIGENPASLSFIRQKQKIASLLGIKTKIETLKKNVSAKTVIQTLKKFSNNKQIGGIIIQLPLPKHLNREEILKALPEAQDIDRIGHASRRKKNETINSPPIGVVEEILKLTERKIEKLNIAIIGHGFLIGKPIEKWLREKTQKLKVFPEKSKTMKTRLKKFDLIISGAGAGKIFDASHLKNNAVVIDFGWKKNKKTGIITGDFDTEKNAVLLEKNIIRYTKTPGGTGPILVAKIMENFFALTAKTSKNASK